MTSFLQLALLLSVILVSAKLAGYLSQRIGQPSVLGELLVGILLGPSLLNILELPFIDYEMAHMLKEMAELGVMLLMFLAGMELHLSDLAKSLRPAMLGGLLGVAFPLLTGWGLGAVFGMDTPAALFLGLVMGATSVSISAQTLIELKVLRSRVGIGLLGAAVFDDILVILLLSIFLALQGGGGTLLQVSLVVVKMIIFLGLSIAVGVWGIPWLMRRTARLPISQGVVTVALVVMLAYGLAAELVGGMAAITGAFLAGVMTARTIEKERIEAGMHALAYALFVPIFFINIGLAVNLRELTTDVYVLALAVTVAAILAKWLGAGLGARLGGMTNRESLQLGAGMISRGEVGLIVASVGTREGLVAEGEFSAIVAMVVVTTMITPPILRALFAGNRPQPVPADPETMAEE